MYYYTYRIDILDGSGRYYLGQRRSRKKPEEDWRYKGSGRSLKNLYRRHGGYQRVRDGEFYKKTILGVYSSQEELNKAEKELIGDLFRNDYKCLNRISGK